MADHGHSDTHGSPDDGTVSADDALARLMEGNARFLAVEANVHWSLQQFLETPEGRARLAEGRLKLVGAVCEIATGRVRWLA